MIDNQPNNCVTLHLRSAFPLEDLETSAIQESPAGQALPCITRRDNPQRHETSRLGDVVGGAAAGGATRENAAAQKRALQGPIAVHAATAESGHLTGRVQPGQRGAVGLEYPCRQVS